MSNQLSELNPEILASLILNGDIAKLTSIQRVEYITKLCERVGIDPLTQPFKILRLNGREVLYADKGCAQQLCKVYGISTEITKKEKIEDVYSVTVRASNKEGRFTDEDGIVTIGNLKGDTLANALMKAVTKAKRRSVLAFCGLGILDETEIETIKGAQVIDINKEPLKLPTAKSEASTVQEPLKQPQDAPGTLKTEKTEIPIAESEPSLEKATELFGGKEVTDITEYINETTQNGIKKIAKQKGFTGSTFKEWLKKYFDLESLSKIPVGALHLVNKKLLAMEDSK